MPQVWRILGVALGLVLAVAGLWLMRAARTRIRRMVDADAGEQVGEVAASRPPRAGEHGELRNEEGLAIAPASRYAFGILFMVLGYHAIAYSSPSHWLPIRVPLDRVWMLGVMAVVVVAGVLASEAVERFGRQSRV